MNSKELCSFFATSILIWLSSHLFESLSTGYPSQGASDMVILMKQGWLVQSLPTALWDNVFSLSLAFCFSPRHEAVSSLRELWLLSRLFSDLYAHFWPCARSKRHSQLHWPRFCAQVGSLLLWDLQLVQCSSGSGSGEKPMKLLTSPAPILLISSWVLKNSDIIAIACALLLNETNRVKPHYLGARPVCIGRKTEIKECFHELLYGKNCHNIVK